MNYSQHNSYSLQQLKSLISEAHNLVDFFNFELGINVSHEGQAVLAPHFIRHENHPSFAVYNDHAFDFSTHTLYSFLDIYALYAFGSNDFDNIKKSAELLSGKKLGSHFSDSSASDFTSQQQAFNKLIHTWHLNLLNNPVISPNGKDIPALDYFTQRRISIDTIKTLQIGFSPLDDADRSLRGRLVFPYFWHNHDNPFYANGRSAFSSIKDAPKYKKIFLQDSRFNLILRNSIWGLDSQYPGRIVKDTRVNPNTGDTETLETHHLKYDFLVIPEGVFDALAFWQEGWQVASSLGCGFSQEQKKELLNCCRHYASKNQKILLCLDNDSAGDNGQYSLALFLFKHRIPFVVASLPKSITASYELHPDFGQVVPIKDVSDYYSAGGSLDALASNAKSGAAFLAEHCKNEQELDKLFQDTAKFADESELFALKQAAINIMDDNGEVEFLDKKTGQIKTVMDQKHRFDKNSVNFFYAMACKPLKDSVIAEITCKAHQLIYDTAGQFYEYSSGIWRAVHDLVIQRYISEAMNNKLSAGKLANVCKFLKISLAAQNLQFNTQPLWCFKNGTLWLDEDDGIGKKFLDDEGNTYVCDTPRNFKPSSPDDMSTIQLPYFYSHKSVNRTWLKYVSEWMSGEQDKITLLQQMVGYVLYASNTLQKFFYLIGDGANGKSTFLHILTKLFGKDNCSSLQFHRFSSEFDTIALKNSRLNICYDARTELGCAEDMLKAMSSGDTIMAAHKGVDAEAFTPNAKIFVAANKFFSASDTSKGLLRRILFVCFNQDFSGDGQKFNIEDEIKNDPSGLAGVFNWAYDGYKMLKKSGAFIETQEQQALVEEFKAQLSPLMVFAREKMYTLFKGGYIRLNMKDEVFNGSLSEKELYALYRDWADDNGEKKFSRTKFIYEIRQVLRTDGSDIIAERDERSGLWSFIFPELGEDFSQDIEETIKEGQETHQEKTSDAQESAPSHSTGTPETQGSNNKTAHQQVDPKLKAQQELQELEDSVRNPDYVVEGRPFDGWTNGQIWQYAVKCIDFLKKGGREWKALASKMVHSFKVYYAINYFMQSDNDRRRYAELSLPGYWDFWMNTILPNFNPADDENMTMIPADSGQDSHQDNV